MLMTRLIERILKAENIEVDYIEIGHIISHSQGDLRRLVNICRILILQQENRRRSLRKFGKMLVSYCQNSIKKLKVALVMIQ